MLTCSKSAKKTKLKQKQKKKQQMTSRPKWQLFLNQDIKFKFRNFQLILT